MDNCNLTDPVNIDASLAQRLAQSREKLESARRKLSQAIQGDITHGLGNLGELEVLKGRLAVYQYTDEHGYDASADLARVVTQQGEVYDSKAKRCHEQALKQLSIALAFESYFYDGAAQECKRIAHIIAELTRTDLEGNNDH